MNSNYLGSFTRIHAFCLNITKNTLENNKKTTATTTTKKNTKEQPLAGVLQNYNFIEQLETAVYVGQSNHSITCSK